MKNDYNEPIIEEKPTNKKPLFIGLTLVSFGILSAISNLF